MLFLYALLISILSFYLLGISSIFQILLSSLILYFSFIYLLHKIYHIEISTGLDAIAHTDTNINRSHIVSCAIMDEQIDPISIIETIKKRTFIHPYYQKLKKKMNSFMLVHYWSYCPEFNIDNHIEVIDSNFNKLDDLYKFMSSHTSEIPFDYSKPRWKIFIIKKLGEHKSAVVWKFHHSIGDGVCLLGYGLNVGDCKEYNLVKLPKISYFGWLLIMPVGLIKALFFTLKFLLQSKDRNCFKKNSSNGKKNGFCSLEFSLQEFKDFSKSHKVNLNDIIMAVINEGLRNYHQNKFKEPLNEFKIFLAASLRDLPRPEKPLSLNNKTNFISLEEFPHNEDFMEAAKDYHKTLNSLKSSYDIYFRGFYVDLVCAILPLQFALWMTKIVTDNYSCIFTSVPGPVKKIQMFGYDISELFFFVNSPGLVSFIINVFTYNNQISFCCFTDEATGINSKELVNEFKEVINREIYKIKE